AKIDFQPQTETKTELEKTADLLGVAPEPLRARPAPTAHGFDTSIPTGPDVGQQVRAEKPPLPRGERRTQVRTPEEIQTQELFGKARKELGEDATSDQVMARVEELKEATGGTPQGQGRRTAEEATGVSRPESGDQLSAPGETRPRVNAPAGKAGAETRETAVEPKFKHGSTQANIPAESEAHTALEAARQRISDSDVMAKGKDVGGNHLTVRYGIQGENTEGIKNYLRSLSPFEAKLGKTEKFAPTEHSDGAAVIQAPIESPELHKINQEIAQHGDFAESSFPEYKPHATIAYVKPEAADRYVGMGVTAGKTFKVSSIAITDREGKQEEIKLEGKGTETKYVLPSFVTHGLAKNRPAQEVKPAAQPAAATPKRIDYARMQQVYPKQKATLTRAEKLEDPGARRDAVVKAAKEAIAEWDKIGAWPDNWSRWQRAVDDAEFKARRAGLPAMENTRLEELETAPAGPPTAPTSRPATTPAAPTTAHVDDIKEVVNKPVSPHGIKATIEPE